MSFKISVAKAALVIVLITLAPTLPNAETVTLETPDGRMSLTGDLIGVESGHYIVETTIGELRVPVENVSCNGDACPTTAEQAAPQFVISGSNTIGAALMPKLIEAFGNYYGLPVFESIGDQNQKEERIFTLGEYDVELFADIQLFSHGSSTGISDLLAGAAEIAMASRPMKETEIQAMLDAGLGDARESENQIIVGLDGLIVVVAQDNPVDALSMEQIANIFSGNITNWSEVGGPNQSINVYRRDDNSGTTGVFVKAVMDPAGLTFSPNSKKFESNVDLVNDVFDDPYGIGFTGIAYLGNVKALSLVESCGFESSPTEFTIKTGEYPLARELYLYTSSARFEGPEGQAESISEFLWFLQSEVAQISVAESGFINQAVTKLDISQQGQRLINTMSSFEGDVPFSQVQAAVEELSGATRLSSTFRFRTGSSVLDVRSEGSIPRLIEYLLTNNFDGKEILLAGFTDSAGRAFQNAQLGKRRAESVMTEILAALGPQAANFSFNAIGFGEVSPLGCNNTPSGRDINRRVEVWLRAER